jgi:hypothetical protein
MHFLDWGLWSRGPGGGDELQKKKIHMFYLHFSLSFKDNLAGCSDAPVIQATWEPEAEESVGYGCSRLAWTIQQDLISRKEKKKT